MNHRKIRKAQLAYLPVGEPPNSPPTNTLLAIKTMKHTRATQRNTTTENASGPDLTSYPLPSFPPVLFSTQYIDPIAHGRPHPRKTFTAFEPLILPTAASAFSDYFAAVILAKVSGSEVPRATIVIAATDSLM